MDKKSFNSTDICRIINKAGQMGVAELTLGDLHVKFTSQSPAKNIESSREELVGSELKLQAAPSQVFESNKDTLRSFDENLEEDAQFAQTMIDDPVEFERLQILEGLEAGRLDEEV